MRGDARFFGQSLHGPVVALQKGRRVHPPIVNRGLPGRAIIDIV